MYFVIFLAFSQALEVTERTVHFFMGEGYSLHIYRHWIEKLQHSFEKVLDISQS